jgi:DNA-binding transcriptional LysR family regulator
VLLAEGRSLLAEAQRVVRVTRAAAPERLTVGFYGSAAGTLLAEALRAFADRHPTVGVSLRELLLGGVDDIVGGKVDVAFTRLEPGQTEISVEVIAREPRLVALPIAHPLAARDALTFSDLREQSFITNPVVPQPGSPTRWLAEQRRHGLPGRVAAEAASVGEILTLVATGRGVCLVPASVARHYPRADVRYVAVSDAAPALVSLAWNPRHGRPVVEAFIATVREFAAAGASPVGTGA